MATRDPKQDETQGKVVVNVNDLDELVRIMQVLFRRKTTIRPETLNVEIDLSSAVEDIRNEYDVDYETSIRIFLGARGFSEEQIDEFFHVTQYGSTGTSLVTLKMDERVVTTLEAEGYVRKLGEAFTGASEKEADDLSDALSNWGSTVDDLENNVDPQPKRPFPWKAASSWRSVRLLAIGGVGGLLGALGLSSLASQGVTLNHVVGGVAVVLLLIGLDRVVAALEMLRWDRAIRKEAKETARRIAQMEI